MKLSGRQSDGVVQVAPESRAYDPRTYGADCDNCPLGHTVAVPPVGGTHGSDLVVIAEGPSSAEVANGRASLTSPGTEMVLHALERAGRTGREAWLTRTVLCKPPGYFNVEEYVKDLRKENKRRDKAQKRYDRERTAADKRNWRRITRQAKAIQSAAKKDAAAMRRAHMAWKKECAKLRQGVEKAYERELKSWERAVARIEKQNAKAAKKQLPEQPLPKKPLPPEMPEMPAPPPPPPLFTKAFFRKPTKTEPNGTVLMGVYKPDPETKVAVFLPTRAEGEPVGVPVGCSNDAMLDEWPEHPGDTTIVADPVECCRPRVEHELRRAKTVMLCGNLALQSYTDRKSVFEEMGAPIPMEIAGRSGVWGIPQIHPAAIRRIGSPLSHFEGTFHVFTQKAVRIAREGVNWKDPDPLYTPERVSLALRRLLREADERMWTPGGKAPRIPVAIDVETGPNPEMEANRKKGTKKNFSAVNTVFSTLRVVGFSWGEQAAVVPLHTMDGRYIGNSHVIQLARKVLQHPWILKIGHNGVFDWSVLAANGMPTRPPYADTLMQHYVVEPEMPHTLAFVSSLMLDAPAWKQELGSGDHGLSARTDQDLWLYNAVDCYRTVKTHEALLPYVEADDVEAVYQQHMRLTPAVVEMNNRGLVVVPEQRERVRERLVREHERCLAEMHDILAQAMDERPGSLVDDYRKLLDGEPFTYSKPDHKEAALILLDIQTPTKEKSGRRSTEAETLIRTLPEVDELAQRWIGVKIDEHTDGAGFLGAGSTQKLLSTFVDVVLNPDGRVRSSWKPHGAKSGRFSSSGPNLQNIPAWVRQIYGTEEGYRWVAADYGALELWVVAIYTGAVKLLRALQSKDVHRFNTEGLFNVDFAEEYTRAAQTGCRAHHGHPDWMRSTACTTETIPLSDLEITDHGKKLSHVYKGQCPACAETSQKAAAIMMDKLISLRVQAKRFVYNANYEGSDVSIWLKLKVEFPDLQLSDVTRMMHAWKSMNPEIGQTAKKNYELFFERQLREGAGYLTSPILGRRRHWANTKFAITDAANYPIQSGGADIINAATERVYARKCREIPDAFLLAQVHDALDFEAPEARAEDMKRILEEEMPGAYRFKDRPGVWTFPVEAAIGTYWSET